MTDLKKLIQDDGWKPLALKQVDKLIEKLQNKQVLYPLAYDTCPVCRYMDTKYDMSMMFDKKQNWCESIILSKYCPAWKTCILYVNASSVSILTGTVWEIKVIGRLDRWKRIRTLKKIRKMLMGRM